jgi:DNA-binding response OmpR family regulator
MEPQLTRVLLVEPDYLHAHLVAENLGDGFVFQEETSPVDASLLLLEDSKPFDLAIVNFPFLRDQTQDTVELLDILRYLNMPRVVASVVGREELEGVYPLQNGEGYLEKPFRDDELGRVVAETLDKR